ncbi:MAG: hypothetical protein GW859_10515 [Sphingomonadales bacterium]|nr:hypothetical protein [Sphingomonadales bacterium]
MTRDSNDKEIADPIDQPEGIVETARSIADMGDHLRLLAVNGAVLVAGLVFRKPQMVRAGVRMTVSQGIALGLRTLLTTRVHAAGLATESDVSQGKVASESAAESAVATGSSAATIAASKAAADGTGLPYVPARLIGLAVTGGDRPKSANVLADFAVGSAIGFVAEWIGSRLIPDRSPDDPPIRSTETG